MYDKIRFISLPSKVIEMTETLLRNAGERMCECFILWVGRQLSPEEFVITRCIMPKQWCIKTPSGVGVLVKDGELFRISKELYEANELAIAQVHSHPDEAYHSSADDAIPLVTTIGQFSIVVPKYGNVLMNKFDNIKFFRLTREGWNELQTREADAIFRVA